MKNSLTFKYHFVFLCNKYCVDVNIAMENKLILKAIENEDLTAAEEALKNEF